MLRDMWHRLGAWLTVMVVWPIEELQRRSLEPPQDRDISGGMLGGLVVNGAMTVPAYGYSLGDRVVVEDGGPLHGQTLTVVDSCVFYKDAEYEADERRLRRNRLARERYAVKKAEAKASDKLRDYEDYLKRRKRRKAGKLTVRRARRR